MTEFCQNHFPENLRTAADPSCVYYPDPYPVNCSYVQCRTIIQRVKAFGKNITGVLNFSVVHHVHIRTPLHDHIPCAKNKWCMNGQCESTTDSRVKSYHKELKTIDGNFKVDCYNENKKNCVNMKNLPSDMIEAIERCTNKECLFYWDDSDYSNTREFLICFINGQKFVSFQMKTNITGSLMLRVIIHFRLMEENRVGLKRQWYFLSLLLRVLTAMKL